MIKYPGQQKHFLTYGDGIFSQQRKRLSEEAVSSELFHWVHSFSKEDINEFYCLHKELMDNVYGGGWIWKPYLILRILDQMPDNDILIYCDAGCCIVNHKEYKVAREQRFEYYMNLINNLLIPVSAFSPWTKSYWESKKAPDYTQPIDSYDPYIKHRFGIDSEHFKNYPGIEAGFILVRKTPSAICFIQEWLDLLLEDNYKLILQHKLSDQDVLNILFYRHYLEPIYGSDFYGEGPFFAARLTDAGQKPGYGLL